MKAALFKGIAKLELKEIQTPEINGNEVLVKVKCAAICGTDVRMYKNGLSGVSDENPRILGHEISGVIAQAGKNVKKYTEGMRVAVAPNMGCGLCESCISGNGHLCEQYKALGINLDGGFAEYVKIPEAAVRQGNIIAINDNVSFEEAAVNEPFSCVYNGFEHYIVKPGDNVLVVGSGPIGILHLKLAVMAGAANVMLNDLSQERMNKTKELVPKAILVPSPQLREKVFEITKGKGLDVCVIACPSPEAQALSLELMGLGGRVCFFGGLPKSRESVPINTNIIHYKQLILTGSTRASLSQFSKTLSFVENGLVSIKELVTNHYKLDEIVDAIEFAAAGQGIKSVINFD